MTRINICLLLFAITILSSACKKDFLTTPNKQVLIRQTYVTNLATTGEFMRGIYASFASNFYTGHTPIYIELAADNLTTTTGYTTLTAHYQWSQFADDYNGSITNSALSNLNPLWLEGYRIVHNCSFVIETIDEYKEENPVETQRIKAEAYAMRAFTHFLLLNVFAQPHHFSPNGSHAGIPYIRSSKWDDPVSRQSVKECYELIVEDINAALQLFPSDSKVNTQAFNKLATKALLARVYLFLSDFTKAKDLAAEVIRARPLMPSGASGYPQKLFTLQETEALFQLTPASYSSGENIQTIFQGFQFSNGYFLCTNDFANMLTENENDVRKSWIKKVAGDPLLVTKFPSSVVPNYVPAAGGYYATLLRSSEMYLTCAESYAQLGASYEDSARYFLDAIRTRADASAISSTARGAALLDTIYKERRKELAFEGHRLFDLQRWKKEINRPGETNPKYKTLPYPHSRRIAPIPIPDVTLGGLKQNDSY